MSPAMLGFFITSLMIGCACASAGCYGYDPNCCRHGKCTLGEGGCSSDQDCMNGRFVCGDRDTCGKVEIGEFVDLPERQERYRVTGMRCCALTPEMKFLLGQSNERPERPVNKPFPRAP